MKSKKRAQLTKPNIHVDTSKFDSKDQGSIPSYSRKLHHSGNPKNKLRVLTPNVKCIPKKTLLKPQVTNVEAPPFYVSLISSPNSPTFLIKISSKILTYTKTKDIQQFFKNPCKLSFKVKTLHEHKIHNSPKTPISMSAKRYR